MFVAWIVKSKRNALNIFKAARFYNNLLLVSDAIGLGIFTVLGIDAGIAHGYSQNIFFVVFLPNSHYMLHKKTYACNSNPAAATKKDWFAA